MEIMENEKHIKILYFNMLCNKSKYGSYGKKYGKTSQQPRSNLEKKGYNALL